jgi:hypothetical protein
MSVSGLNRIASISGMVPRVGARTCPRTMIQSAYRLPTWRDVTDSSDFPGQVDFANGR